MKRIVLFLLAIGFTALANSCEYDDSNDIDILKPTDSTETGITIHDAPK